jgi:toxin ParE1/3/4
VTRYRVEFRREALQQLEDLYDFIADAGSPANAAGFAESIVTFCEGLSDFPYRGVAREDLRPGLRTIGFRKRVVIAYAILNETVAIIGVFYGGRDHEQILRDSIEPDDPPD